MSRFYQTSNATPMDWAYNMPYQEMFQGVLAKQQQQDAYKSIGDKLEAQGQSLQFLNKDRDLAQRGMQWINDNVDQFSNQDLTDPVNRNKLRSFAKEVSKSFSSSGQYGNIQANYDAYQNYAKQLEDNKNLQGFQREKAKQYYLQNYQGVGGNTRYGGEYNRFQGSNVSDYVDLNTEWNKIAKDIQSDVVERGGSSPAGMYIKDWERYQESTSQEKLAMAYSGLLASPKVQSYLSEGKEYGWLNKDQFDGSIFDIDDEGKILGGNQNNYLGTIYNAGAAQKGFKDKQKFKLKPDSVKIAHAKMQAYEDANKPYLPETRDTSIKNRLKPELQGAIKDLKEGKSAKVSMELNNILSPAEYSEYLQGVKAMKSARGADIKKIAGNLRQKVSFWLATKTEGEVVDIGNLAFGESNPSIDIKFTDPSQINGNFVDEETQQLIASLTGQDLEKIKQMPGEEIESITEKYDEWSKQNGMSLASSTPLYGKAQTALNNRFFNPASGFNTEGKADKIMVRKPGSDEAKLVNRDELEKMDKAIKEKVSNGNVAAFTANNSLNPEYIGGYRAQVNVDGETWEVYIPADDNINISSSQQFNQFLSTGQGRVNYENLTYDFQNKWNEESNSIEPVVVMNDGEQSVTLQGQNALIQMSKLNNLLQQNRQKTFENFAGNLNQLSSVSKAGEMLLSE